jgi:hypothetical protein
MTSRHHLLFAKLTLAILCSGSAVTALAAGGHERPHSFTEARGALVIDSHHGHDRFYPRVGAVVPSLGPGYFTTRFRGVPYYFHEGSWYRSRGRSFVVVQPPIGAFVTVLPPFYTTLMFGGIPYYYADNVYYRWDAVSNGYLVSQPPQNAESVDAASGSANQVFVYPKNAQSAEQQAKDRYECYRWAADQSGFDPTRVGNGTGDHAGNATREAYERAQAACLEARGYSVK